MAKELHLLPWAKTTAMLNLLLGITKAPTVELLDDEEYTGEDGETLAEYKARVSNINRIRQQNANEAHKEAVAMAKKDIAAFHGYVPALLPVIGRLPLIFSEGKVDIVNTTKSWADLCETNKITYTNGTVLPLLELRAIVYFLKCSVRAFNYGKGKQTDEAVGYNASVPLVLRAFKEYQNIPYEKFPRTPDLLRFVDAPTMQIMLWDDNSLTDEDLLEIRSTHISSGSEHLEIRNPKFSALEVVPLKHTKFMLAQLWIYRPSLYHSFCIHNPKDWDSPMPALVKEELFVPKPQKLVEKRISKKTEDTGDIPW